MSARKDIKFLLAVARDRAERQAEVEQAALISLAEFMPAGEWRKPSKERAAWWFEEMRRAAR